jgi:putative copper export protein
MSDEVRAILRADDAALFGMVGIVGMAVFLLAGPAIQAIGNHWSYADSWIHNAGRWPPLVPPLVKLAVLALAFVGFAMARKSSSRGWTLATIASFVFILEPEVAGDIFKRVNTVHLVAVSTWLGTLLLLTVIGIRGLSRSSISGIQRSRLVADMVNVFSPLALVGFSVAALFGVWTASLHLKRFSSLWTTPWGWVFDVKLTLALIVISIGAWNWQRVRPSLGGEGSEEVIRKSATRELTVAALVVLVAGLLVTIPRPK